MPVLCGFLSRGRWVIVRSEGHYTFEIVAIDEAGRAHRNWIGSPSFDGSQPWGDWMPVPPPPSRAGTLAGVALSSDEDVAVVTPDGEIFRLRTHHQPSLYFEWVPWPVLPVANQVFSDAAQQ